MFWFGYLLHCTCNLALTFFTLLLSGVLTWSTFRPVCQWHCRSSLSTKSFGYICNTLKSQIGPNLFILLPFRDNNNEWPSKPCRVGSHETLVGQKIRLAVTSGNYLRSAVQGSLKQIIPYTPLIIVRSATECMRGFWLFKWVCGHRSARPYGTPGVDIRKT